MPLTDLRNWRRKQSYSNRERSDWNDQDQQKRLNLKNEKQCYSKMSDLDDKKKPWLLFRSSVQGFFIAITAFMIARAMCQVQRTSIDLKASKEIDENLEMIKEERVVIENNSDVQRLVTSYKTSTPSTDSSFKGRTYKLFMLYVVLYRVERMLHDIASNWIKLKIVLQKLWSDMFVIFRWKIFRLFRVLYWVLIWRCVTYVCLL